MIKKNESFYFVAINAPVRGPLCPSLADTDKLSIQSLGMKDEGHRCHIGLCRLCEKVLCFV